MRNVGAVRARRARLGPVERLAYKAFRARSLVVRSETKGCQFESGCYLPMVSSLQ